MPSAKHPKVYISHSYEDRKLAAKLSALLLKLSGIANVGPIEVLYSDDADSRVDLSVRERVDRLSDEIDAAKLTIALVSPESNEKAWIAYESGLSFGRKKNVRVISFFMKDQMINPVYQNRKPFNGEDQERVAAFCKEVLEECTDKKISKENVKVWDPLIADFHTSVQQEKNDMFFRTLFQDHFHNRENAQKLEGKWIAKWTELHEDGKEDIFEKDELRIWTTEKRIRVVGYSQKKGVEGSNYPMEGIVSPTRKVALSYWSEGEIPICGVCLLKPKGLMGDTLIGTWQGFTARSIDDEPRFTRGRVILSRREEIVDAFPEKSDS